MLQRTPIDDRLMTHLTGNSIRTFLTEIDDQEVIRQVEHYYLPAKPIMVVANVSDSFNQIMIPA